MNECAAGLGRVFEAGRLSVKSSYNMYDNLTDLNTEYAVHCLLTIANPDALLRSMRLGKEK